ncbi:cytokine receptor-like factor 2 isoform X3 [Pongo pygmaeus]|uniref:cytokine receptor-like factor 2 isoform X3 n=1 Tax=Pongo pygmaeus TaxID=9600 RepID=UPI0023E32553|nr:cytokine receptor-like factor 2 isoform X3 [Pongo pygmaeus]
MASGQVGTGEGVQIQIIYFNLETVQVTWNASKYSRTNLTFHYRFSGDEAYDQCTNYLLQEDHTSGCLLDAEQRDDILYFSIRNGTHPVFTASRWIVYYLKPSSPKHVSFSWHQDAVTVTCSDLSYGDLLYEVQYRSPFDMEWQSKQENTCNVTIEGLDAEKCYSFWVRVKAMEDSYGPDTYPSDWSEVTCWQRGEIRDSCAETPTPPKPKLSRFILISSLAILLMVPLLLLSLWKLWRSGSQTPRTWPTSTRWQVQSKKVAPRSPWWSSWPRLKPSPPGRWTHRPRTKRPLGDPSSFPTSPSKAVMWSQSAASPL